MESMVERAKREAAEQADGPVLHECPKGRGELPWQNCCGHLYIKHRDQYVRTLHVSGALPSGLHLDVHLDFENGVRHTGAGMNLSWDEVDRLLAHVSEIRRRAGA